MMKKYFNFLFALVLISSIGIGASFQNIAEAYPPTDGGAGDASKIGKVTCISRYSSGEFAPGVYLSVVTFGTDKYFYLAPEEPNDDSVPFLRQYNSNDLTNPVEPLSSTNPLKSGKIYPVHKPRLGVGLNGSGTNRISFSYQTPTTPSGVAILDGVQLSSINHTLNPLLEIDSTGLITIAQDGSKSYPFDWSNLNDSNMPVCTGPVKSIVIPNPTCTDGVKNGDETGIDTGGHCDTGSPGSLGGGLNGACPATWTGTYPNCTAPALPAGVTNGAPNGGSGVQWGNYHWPRSANPLTLNVGNNLSAEYQASFLQAIADWNLSSVINLVPVTGRSSRISDCAGASGVMEVCDANYGNTQWVGIASISSNGSHITAARIRLNRTYLSKPQYQTEAWKMLVMCQEIGHGFGLDHQDEGQSNPTLHTCMDYTNHNEGDNIHPNINDLKILKEKVYQHLD